MDNVEAAKILAILKASYPNAYRGLNQTDTKAVVFLWANAFKQEDYTRVSKALLDFINNDPKGFPPTTGQVKSYMTKRQELEQGKLLAVDAWQLVLKAMRNSGTQSVQEFNKMPLEVQRAVGSPIQLKQWALNGDMQQLEYIRSNFCKNFETVSETIVEQHNMGIDDQNFLDAVKAKAKEIEGKTEAPKGQEMDSSEWMRKIRELKNNLGRA